MKRCLLDMDGVLADFHAGALALHDAPDPYADASNLGKWDALIPEGMTAAEFYAPMGESFWANLMWTLDGTAILSAVCDVFGADNVCIATSPCAMPGCAEGKLRWLRRHLPAFSRRFMITSVKHFAASCDTVLVDDSESNVNAFRAAGGYAVLVPRPWNHLWALDHGSIDYVSRMLKGLTHAG